MATLNLPPASLIFMQIIPKSGYFKTKFELQISIFILLSLVTNMYYVLTKCFLRIEKASKD